ncbi:MAG TPA: hydroxymethylbilane synthase [Thermoanaerobaculia bacterium]|nr:hydroxymethylbilane synthase [Thermoanaerobaculia bacterium]
MTRPIRIGTRGSQLALWQANQVAARLAEKGLESELRVIRTTGDLRRDVSLASIGGKGLFIKEIEEALGREEIDFAVHSLKDVPSVIPAAFRLAGFLERADPRDAWVQPSGLRLDAIPAGAVIGTSSPRRRAQLLHHFPDVRIEEIRGNVDTRMEKLRQGLYHGAVLAAAGLTRLGRGAEIVEHFSLDRMIPAAGQGIVAIETLGSRDEMLEVARSITDPIAALAARIERGLLQRFETILDCTSAIGVHAAIDHPNITLRVFLSDGGLTRVVRFTEEGTAARPDELIDRAAGRMRDEGAVELLEEASRRAGR